VLEASKHSQTHSISAFRVLTNPSSSIVCNALSSAASVAFTSAPLPPDKSGLAIFSSIALKALPASYLVLVVLI
jgi:hypothetical protein